MGTVLIRNRKRKYLHFLFLWYNEKNRGGSVDKSSKRTKILFFSAGTLILLFLVSGYFQLAPLGTDAGFDVDFDTGSSGGGDGSIFDLIYLALHYPILTLIIVISFIIITMIENNNRRKADGSNADSIKKSSHSEEEKELLLQAYEIFYNVQKAWMNFDYEKLRTLVTDELFNTYQTELQTLELKGQKNIMRDFTVKHSSVLSHKEENNNTTIVISLNVSFYDYIVDSNGKVLRGKDTRKVTMFYHLTFVANLVSNDKCPNCGAPLENPSYCDYCKSHIQALSTNLRLAKKQAIKQKEE